MDGETLRLLEALTERLAALEPQARLDALNAVRTRLHAVSPLRGEPVDLVLWVPAASLRANAYNPNRVAPPELALLRRSVREDGFTQPVVAAPDAQGYEVVDGFHRQLVAREPAFSRRLLGRVPVTPLTGDLAARMAATVRHNRARGQHTVAGMEALTRALAQEGQDAHAVMQALGMEAEELLRLRQTAGAASALAQSEYSDPWEVEEDA